ncbi:hypothetical protein GO986_17855 [Deinococcus sp. HMF7620]|uniref:MarR family transcriptional regulator n=1 Tax=Deinococcus arboris TaxID=2682977 RepID=A0A7C9MT37_9DEIO|nr:hypothetical protein [Deinococcus arboris]MVN88604.1 hypothetical protein [Deinococcus arboris]
MTRVPEERQRLVLSVLSVEPQTRAEVARRVMKRGYRIANANVLGLLMGCERNGWAAKDGTHPDTTWALTPAGEVALDQAAQS